MTQQQVSSQFTSASNDFHQSTPLDKRKKLGQYMTPALISKHLVSELDIRPNEKVLDPAVGTGELLFHASLAQPDAYYEGWDIDESILSYAKQNVPDATLKARSALESGETGEWDVIIANPPYFEMKLSDAQKTHFAPVLGGRPNIFTLFFYQAIRLLKDNGRLGFIVPPSMNNGAFFLNLRRFLTEQGHVKHIKVFTDSKLFHGAQTAAQVIVIEKGVKEEIEPFIFTKDNKPFFVENREQILSFWEGKETLYDLGYRAITGSIVWNKYKDRFTSSKEGVAIVYASDIGLDGKLEWNDNRNSKRRYIAKQENIPTLNKAIVVNRITGGLGSQSLRAALVKEEFYGENHVNVILPRPDVEQKVSFEELLKKVQGADTNYIAAFTGNTQISAKELERLLPL